MEVVVGRDEASSRDKHFGLEKEINLRQTVISLGQEHCDKSDLEDVDEVKFVKKSATCIDNENIPQRLDSTYVNGISDCQWPQIGSKVKQSSYWKQAVGSKPDLRDKWKAPNELSELCMEDEKEDWVTPGRVLSMSLVKLRTDQNLLKFVVINNTVRSLEERIKLDILNEFKNF